MNASAAPDLVPKAHTGPLMPHQQRAVERLAQRQRIFLADDTGLGKTRTALAWAASRGAERVLIAAPPTVMRKWEAEIGLYAPGAAVQLLRATAKSCPPQPTGYVIVSLDSARSSLFQRLGLAPRRFDALIIDESHNLKTWTSQRTRAWTQFIASGPHLSAAMLSATPITRDPSDLIAQLAALGQFPYGKAAAKFIRYELRTVPQVGGGERTIREPVGWLQKKKFERCFALISSRSQKREVLKNFPALAQQTLEIPVSEHDFRAQLEWLLQRRCGAAEGADLASRICRGDGLTTDKIASLIDDLGVQIIGDILHAAGLSKSGGVAEYLNQTLGREQIVVFVSHRSVASRISGDLKIAHQVIDGEVAPDDRQRICGRYERGEFQVLIATYGCCGVGIDLVAGHRAMLAELHYSAAVEKQAVDRVHRIGQTRDCLVQRCLAIGRRGEPWAAESRVLNSHQRKVRLAALQGAQPPVPAGPPLI